MIDLLPCPFCGSDAELLTFWDFYKFSCKNTDCTAHVADAPYVQHAEGTWYGSIDEARAAWNIRAERTCHDTDENDWHFVCSDCGYEQNGYEQWNYCPNCGAKVVKR